MALALGPLALLYGAVSGLRNLGYRTGLLGTERLGVPVVVVGNVIAGGAGKTPTTMAVIDHLRTRGERPGILSRGYGRQLDALMEVGADSDPAEVGDEPLLMHLRTGAPVMVGRDRVAAGRALLAAHPEITMLVCDDGLQHLRLARDLEILVFDERGTGNGWFLPAGPLRDSAGRRADLVLYNAEAPSTPRPGFLAHRLLGPAIPLAAWRRGEREGLPPGSLRGRKMLAVAGIAHPRRFFAMLEGEGLDFERMPAARPSPTTPCYPGATGRARWSSSRKRTP